MKLKNPVQKPPASHNVHEVFSSSGPQGEIAEMEENYNLDYNEEDLPEDKTLIKLTLTCYGRPVTAVIDTGSQLNIVSQSTVQQKIQLPVDLTKGTTMSVANGESGQLDGLIRKVPLRCGAVLTEANLFVGQDHLPFDLLLGCPWQLQNKVSIDERKNGTYLVFKDQETDQPMFEVFINPTQVVPKTFKSYKRSGVYAALTSLEAGPNENVPGHTETCIVDIPCNEKTVTAQVDTGSNVDIVSEEKAQELELTIVPEKEVIILDDQGIPLESQGVKERICWCTNKAEIHVESRLQAVKEPPCDLIIGYKTMRLLSITEDEMPPEHHICEEDLKIEEKIGQGISQQLFKGLESGHLEESPEDEEEGADMEILTRNFLSFAICALQHATELDEYAGQRVTKETCCEITKPHPEYISGPKSEPPTGEIVEPSLVKDVSPKIEAVGPEGEIDQKANLEMEISEPEWSESSMDQAKDPCQVEEQVDNQSSYEIPMDWLLPDTEDEERKVIQKKSQRKKQSPEVCSHKGDETDSPEDQNLEPRSLEMKEIRSRVHTEKPPERSVPKADRSTLEKYIYMFRSLRVNPRIVFPAMDNPARAYVPPPDGPVHPILNIPMHQVYSAVARQHSQEVFDQTNFFYKPPIPLQLKASHVLLATNNKVNQDSIIPFNWAELVSANVELDFLVDGKRHTVTGNAYIQFTYFSGDCDSRNFINSLNAHPPFPSRNCDGAAEAIDVINASVIATENSVPQIEEFQTEDPPGPLNSDDNNDTLDNRSTSTVPTTLSSALNDDDKPCPPVGQAIASSTHVLFTAVTGPKLPPAPSFPLPLSRPLRVIPLPVVDEERPQTVDDEQSNKETTENETSYALVQRNTATLGRCKITFMILNTDENQSKDLRCDDTSTSVLAYGPFISSHKPANALIPFKYQVYLRSTNRPLLSPLQFAYGNYPHVPIDYLSLADEIDDNFVAALDDDRLQFIILAHYLVKFHGRGSFPSNFEINPKHLVHGWVPPSARSKGTLVFHYPLVEILLSLAMYLI
jgi:hypothetical protein